MKLYDEIQRRGSILPGHGMGDKPDRDRDGYSTVTMRHIDEAVVFVIDNVVAHAMTRKPAPIHDYPTIRPPFDVCFVEAELPRLGAWADLYDDGVRRLGALVLVEDDAHVTDIGQIGRTIGAIRREMPDAVDRVVRFFGFAQWRLGSSFGPFASVAMMLNAEGGMSVDSLGKSAILQEAIGIPFDDRESRQIEAFTDFVGDSVALAFALCHCRNVSVTENDGRYPSRQARRLAERRNEPRPARFWTLTIDPMRGDRLKSGGERRVGGGVSRSMHIARGHIAEYGDAYGKGRLFGKYEGRFWVPAHVRGTAEAGLVGKDYRIRDPKDAA